MRSLQPPYPPEPPMQRLRDHFGDRSDVANRAGEIIRAIVPPGPMAPAASARVLSAVRGGPGRGAWWLQRVALVVATLVVVGATAAGAAAALELIKLSWRDGPQMTPLPPPPPAEHERPPPAAITPPAPVPPKPRPVEPTPAEPPPAMQLEDARLLIDPHARAHRPQLPAEFAQQHAGQVFTWKVNVCVSAAGTVDSARLAAPVHPQLDRRLLRTIAGWRYQPARLDGRPVRSCADVAYRLTVEPARGKRGER
jgi:outer membrane biosynthesis protein TonB